VKQPVEVAGPAEEPVSVAEMKVFARIDDSEEDPTLAELLAEARALAEERTWSRFVTQTHDAYYDGFTDLANGLPYPPVASITSVTYVDTNGDTQPVANTVYELGENIGIGVVRLQYDQTWPTDVRSHPDSVIVRFTCGYGAASAVPLRIRQAIIVYATHLCDGRDETDEPPAFNNLLSQYSFRSFVPPYWGRTL
jgi:uncharacterized phiE125 gp8 family phage protein